MTRPAGRRRRRGGLRHGVRRQAAGRHL